MESISLGEDFINVGIGEVCIASKGEVLGSFALGSCVAVTVYSPHFRAGGLAHIMLPGRAQRDAQNKTKYAQDAIDVLLGGMENLGARKQNLKLTLVGGANVLGEGSISQEVVRSVLGYLDFQGLKPQASRLGGTNSRRVFLETNTGRVFYAEGGLELKELFSGKEEEHE